VLGTLGIATSLYIGASLVVTGMMQWNTLNGSTPLASAFTSVGVDWATTLIAAVTVTALTSSTLCSLFGQPRIFFRMAKDGLLFKIFSKVHPRTKAPIYGTLITGLTAGIIAFAMDLDALSEMISIGTLFAFSTVCAGVVTLRVDAFAYPRLPFILLICFLFPCVGLAVSLRNTDTVPIYVPIVLFVLCCIPTFFLSRLPRSKQQLSYACPLVPFLPLLGVFCNFYLICSLSVWSYLRIAVWTFIGMCIYFGYGIRHSILWLPVVTRDMENSLLKNDGTDENNRLLNGGMNKSENTSEDGRSRGSSISAVSVASSLGGGVGSGSGGLVEKVDDNGAVNA